jgi:hypothetical protein
VDDAPSPAAAASSLQGNVVLRGYVYQAVAQLSKRLPEYFQVSKTREGQMIGVGFCLLVQGYFPHALPVLYLIRVGEVKHSGLGNDQKRGFSIETVVPPPCAIVVKGVGGTGPSEQERGV